MKDMQDTQISIHVDSQQLLMLSDKVLGNGELLDDYDNLDGSRLHLVLMRDYGFSHDDIH